MSKISKIKIHCFWSNQTEQEKQAKENQIRTLNEEMAQQDENIGKLNKEKKSLEETNKKTQEDLQATEDKLNHMSKLKQKLEATLDEVRHYCLASRHLGKFVFVGMNFPATKKVLCSRIRTRLSKIIGYNSVEFKNRWNIFIISPTSRTDRCLTLRI